MSAVRQAPSLPSPLRMPQCLEGIGKVVSAADSADLISGVKILPHSVWADDRGYFLEIIRLGKGLTEGFPSDTTQVSAALNYPGTIKAFHYHLKQTDVWSPVAGMFQVALADLRSDSPSFGQRNTMYVGSLRPWQILIPPGVAHGYKVVGREPALLVYTTDRHYDPADEGRISYNDPLIAYDWNTQHK